MNEFIILENEFLTVYLHPKGAEIHKIIGKEDGINYMWKRDPRQWGSSAPILFPIVGSLNNNQTIIENNTYQMNQHGFARHEVFSIEDLGTNYVVFQLESNEEILKQYPYLFKLQIEYRLENNRLDCIMKVFNNDNKEIYFQIGGHPAFACPFIEGEDVNKYYIEFANKEHIYNKVINLEPKGMNREEHLFFDNEQRFFIQQRLFENDAIVLKDVKSPYLSLKNLYNQKSIRFYLNNFTYLGIWAAKHVGDLIAIEPWVGHLDYLDFNDEFKNKESIVNLNVGKEFICSFGIEINQ